MTEIEQARKGLEAAIRAAKIALSVIRDQKLVLSVICNHQDVITNIGWEAGFYSDLKTAEATLAALEFRQRLRLLGASERDIDELISDFERLKAEQPHS